MKLRFELEHADIVKLDAWLKKKNVKSTYGGAIGGRFTYVCTLTNLGIIVVVKDNIDGDEIDLTDYESW